MSFIEFKTMNKSLQKALLDYASHFNFNFIRVAEFGQSCFGVEEYNSSSIQQYKDNINSIYDDFKRPFKVPKDSPIPVRQIYSVKIYFCDYVNSQEIVKEHAITACCKIKRLV